MKKKNRILTIGIRTIFSSFKRFLSLLVMSLLGVGVFVGLQATAPDMMASLDDYYQKNEVYDLKVVSTFGLTEEDVQALSMVEGVEKVVGTNTIDVLVASLESDFVVNFHTISSTINTIELSEGRLPTQNAEVVVEKAMLRNENLEIGDTLTLLDDTFIEKEVTITGVVDSPLYIEKRSRGTTSLKTGSVDYYMYGLETNIVVDCYSEVYLTFVGGSQLETNSTEYNRVSQEIYERVEDIQKEREEARFQEIYQKASSEIDLQEEEVLQNFATASNELKSAKNQLDSSKVTLDNTKKQLNKAQNQLTSAKLQYQKALEAVAISEEQIELKIKEISLQIADMEALLASYAEDSIQYQTLLGQLEQIRSSYDALCSLKAAKEEIDKNEKKYQTGLSSYQKGVLEYQKALQEYEKSYQEYEEQREEAFQKIEDARNDLATMDSVKWYIYERMDATSYYNFVSDSSSISNLSKLFPTVFFVVAIFISLVSMSRMVEEDRIEIGTLKSLGFSNFYIIVKYFLYSFFATLLGGVLGSILGFIFIPNIIWNIYKILFDVPRFVYAYDFWYIFLGLGIAFFCICGVTIFTVLKNLQEKPASLLRGKAPQAGKRVFLEHFSFLWDHLRFSQKVTFRNIFRYKKRVWMMLLGVSGCTALLLCGFGIRDSIVNITSTHFGRVFTYDELVYVQSQEEEDSIFTLFQNEKVESFVPVSMEVADALSDVYNAEVTLLVPEDVQQLEQILNLYDIETKEKISLEDYGVLITDKLAELMNLKVGDTIQIIDNQGQGHFLPIGKIVENYVGHYVYLTREKYEENFGNYQTNAVYLNTDFTKEEEESFVGQLLENDTVLSVMVLEDFMESVDDMLKSLDSVVVILIILSASLAFAVMYNISNINISERKREIATLKVLGFYDREVDYYIIKENVILTIFGILLGLVFGYFLTHIIITTVEIDKIRFIREIQWFSYLLAAAITMFFTFIVNVITHCALQKIDMSSSLKSVE